ncbi:GIY-YIG nuclease family protein [Aeromonas media]|uniref:GIY-YIG nuclease family protein n=1 Tax=Aeromonas media TaxID=651 RepID=A0ABX6NTG9_AERME|nr:GIY-YIG nuclease family protein [Aeromonas media]MBS4638513.1 GIY-YIG nuclease family protein [Aeromonas media]QJT34081.1 GIY-YIG nuclease family protein [Aeromonas media]QJT39658.1 GIY-YIG nuclease family protein [Aeromonas media]
MEESATDNRGYVYILEVKDIDLPVCKIGMTTRTPHDRCNEINNSSTGDFIWSVAHYIAVDNCRKLESLVHSKLAPLRQKGREFFNINADDANAAIISILDNQKEIKKLNTELIVANKTSKKLNYKRKPRQHSFKRIDSAYAELLQIFTECLNVKGRPFGQLNKPLFGMSDGNRGVQWNISVNTEKSEIRLGVNLEGSEKTGKWLISSFILNNPNIEILKSKIANPKSLELIFSRDAWQGPSRLSIKEKFIGGREYSLSDLNKEIWMEILEEALTCLDENKGFRGRKRNQLVTLESDGRKLIKDISPHLTIWTILSIEGDVEENIKSKISELQPVYDWVVKASHEKMF